MDDDLDDDLDERSTSSEGITGKSDESVDWDKREMPLHGEYRGEYLPHPEEESEKIHELKLYESPEESDNALEVLKDPKVYMIEQLKQVLYNLITDRPENVIDYFEEYVRNIITKDPVQLEMVNIFSNYFIFDHIIEQTLKWIEYKDAPQAEVEGEDKGIKKEYLFDYRMYNFEDSGISLTEIERYGITFALQRTPYLFPVGTVRFWGKIFGLFKNYYIIEAQVTKELLKQDKLEEIEKKAMAAEEEELVVAEEEEYQPKIRWQKVKKLDQYIKPPMPKSTFKPTKYAKKERLGTGVNKVVYLVSNNPADGYVKLPDVLPLQIIRARQIKRFFTGILDQKIQSDPPFPGDESNYLRAQIARISAGTQLSPLGYYSFDIGEAGFEDEEEEEEEEGDAGDFKMKLPKPDYAVNPDFEAIPLQDLVDPSMSYWVHHTAHILRQGRAMWVDPNIDPNKPKPEGEDFEKVEKAEPEVGPPLLTAASDDMNLEMIKPWSTRLTIELSPAYGGAAIRSNLWLGAFAYSLYNDVNFDNIYLGWGLKHNACSYTPMPYFIPQKEYEIGPEVTEITDPNPEEEDYEEILYQQEQKEKRLEKKKLAAEQKAPKETV